MYRRAEAQDLTPYVRKRLRVFFEVWFPDRAEVRITSLLCAGCGFVFYTPRPEDVDLDAKYRFLCALDHDAGLAADAPMEIARSRQLYRAVARLAGRRPRGSRVLDFGGGDGRLMQSFLLAGCECDILDYSAKHIAGVRKLGNSLDDLPSSERYDWIICSHVIEHVANPLQIVERLSRQLGDEGVLYIEVPMEIWGRPPLQDEPVTHINFFTPASLRYMLTRAGLRVSRVRLAGYLHPSRRQLLAVRAVSQRGPGPVVLDAPGDGESRRYLNPGLREKVWRYALTPENIFGAIQYKMKRSRKIG